MYNTELDTSRIISIDVLDKETNKFEPLDRLKLYKFAADSYMCSAYDPYPSLLGSDTLVVEGEQPGTIELLFFYAPRKLVRLEPTLIAVSKRACRVQSHLM